MRNKSDIINLRSSQVHTLLLIFKFRFITASSLTKYSNLSSTSVANSALNILYKQGYLLKRYDKSYRLAGKGAAYSLSKLAIRFLSEHQGIEKSSLHAHYKNFSVSEPFIEHCLNLVEVYIKLRDTYPANFDIHTRHELHGNPTLPDKLPDILLRPINEHNKPMYILELLNTSQFYIAKKRIDYLIRYFEENWDELEYPTILLIVKSGSDETRLLDYCADKLASAGMEDELAILLTSYRTIIANPNPKIWTDSLIPDNLKAL